MQFRSIIYFILFLFLFSCNHQQEETSEDKDVITKKYWNAHLQLTENIQLPFTLSTTESKNDTFIEIYNDEEVIKLNVVYSNDSTRYDFDAYSNYLILKKSDNKINGYFVQPDRTSHNRIPLTGEYYGDDKPEVHSVSDLSVDGKWKVFFNANKENQYPAIGEFNQTKQGRVTGTFMTETGDYRFLDGYVENNQLLLSTFDGSHAFLFTADLNKDTLSGMFYSGRHWSTNWIGVENDTFSLTSPNELTYLVKDSFQFEFPTVENNLYAYPNNELKEKVTIIQILGTWCPNCMDETSFYKDLYNKYNSKGLEIIGVAYEYPSEFKDQAERVKSYIKNLGVPYSILVGGKASKSKASTDFNMLNEISSFPTSIFINKKGEIVKIHTGFNGPGTGEVYSEYVRKTNSLIHKLLNE
ncbi:MAG: redoxin [Fluviicola sp.]|nr:MAG: redoxin [Fluviicola sp.]